MIYSEKKNSVRNNCIELFYENCEKVQFFSEILEQFAKFEKLAKRYGLVREFKTNGLL